MVSPASKAVARAACAAAQSPKGGAVAAPPVVIFPRGSSVLAVGDGDFTFTEALAAAHQPLAPGQFVATGYDTEFEVTDKYVEGKARLARLRAMGADVRCGVDATCLEEGPAKDCGPFDRVVFNFPLLPATAHPTSSGADVQVANRAMLVLFLRSAAAFLKPDGLLIISSKDCYPYSWWRLEAMPQWSGGELVFEGMLPWQHTEYPGLYDGPCNVNRDAAVKPTDATLFLYVHKDNAGGFKRAVQPGLLQGLQWTHGNKPNSGRFICEVCRVAGLGSEQDLAQHVAGKIHKKRVNLEQRWEKARPRYGLAPKPAGLREHLRAALSGLFGADGCCPCLQLVSRQRAAK